MRRARGERTRFRSGARAAALALGALPAFAALAFAAFAALALPAGVARAAEAPPDTLENFLRTLSDSTDAYFGVTAAAPDTAGQDSALAYQLAHPRAKEKLRLKPSLSPDLGFNRVDGPRYGGGLSIGRARQLGNLDGSLHYAAGPNDWLGGGAYTKTVRIGDQSFWALRVLAGRSTEGMDRDFGDVRLAMVRAFVSGNDRKQYLRRDGFQARLEREAPAWRAIVGYRDMLESPLATTATWNLAHATPRVIGNLPAWLGRTHEFELEGAARLPLLPLSAEARWASASHAAGSDLEYRRIRLGLAGDFAIGHAIAIVPQLAYGRLTQEAVPQAAFYLGGSHTLRSVEGASRGGTGMALARLDLIEAPDLLELARIPHPAMFPLQAGVFAGAGAVWGVDPYGGPARGGLDWPDPEHWVSEAGVALLYRPGIPDPAGFMRLEYAWPLGPSIEKARFTMSYTRAMDLLRPLGD